MRTKLPNRGKEPRMRLGSVVVTADRAEIAITGGTRDTISGTLVRAGGAFGVHQLGSEVWEYVDRIRSVKSY